MEIELTELTKTVRKVNVEFPIHLRFDNRIYRINSANKYVAVWVSAYGDSATISTWNEDTRKYISQGEMLTESDFLTALDKAQTIIHQDFISTMEERNA